MAQWFAQTVGDVRIVHPPFAPVALDPSGAAHDCGLANLGFIAPHNVELEPNWLPMGGLLGGWGGR